MPTLIKAHYLDGRLKVCDHRCYESVDRTRPCICSGALRGLGLDRARNMLSFIATAVIFNLLEEDDNLREVEFFCTECTSQENDEA